MGLSWKALYQLMLISFSDSVIALANKCKQQIWCILTMTSFWHCPHSIFLSKPRECLPEVISKPVGTQHLKYFFQSAVIDGLLSIWEGFFRGEPQEFALQPVLFPTSISSLGNGTWVGWHSLVVTSSWGKWQSALKDGNSTKNRPQKWKKLPKTNQTKYKPDNALEREI